MFFSTLPADRAGEIIQQRDERRGEKFIPGLRGNPWSCCRRSHHHAAPQRHPAERSMSARLNCDPLGADSDVVSVTANASGSDILQMENGGDLVSPPPLPRQPQTFVADLIVSLAAPHGECAKHTQAEQSDGGRLWHARWRLLRIEVPRLFVRRGGGGIQYRSIPSSWSKGLTNVNRFAQRSRREVSSERPRASPGRTADH